MVALVRAAALIDFSEVMREIGGNPEDALRRAGLRPALVRERDQLLDATTTARLLEDSAQVTRCETLGLRMARARQLSNFGALSLLLQHQATLRIALQTLIAHVHLLNEALMIELEDAGDLVILREDFLSDSPHRQSIELAVGVLFRMCEALLLPGWRPQSVSFQHAAPQDLSVHRQHFRCPVNFNANLSGIVCRASDLDEPNPMADPVLARYAQTIVETSGPGRQASMAQQVRRAIYLTLPSGGATSKTVAQGLGLSTRTLQRELMAEATTFSDLLEDIRANLARRYVADPRYRIAQIAEMLGYGSHSTFTRWFTSTFGAPPHVWRARAAGMQPAAISAPSAGA